MLIIPQYTDTTTNKTFSHTSPDIRASILTWFYSTSEPQLSLETDTGVVYTKTVMFDLHVEQPKGISHLH